MSHRRYRELLASLLGASHPSNIRWSEVEAMLRHFGAHVEERAGSRIAVAVNGRIAVFHRPHPRKEASRALLRDVRDFCLEAELDREL
jgi:hypothetical protein